MIIDFSEHRTTDHKASNDFETKVLEFINEWNSNSNTVKVKTSGSTGKPKIFDVEKSKMINSAINTNNFLNLKEGNSALLCLPIEYISGKMMIVRSYERKLKLITTDPSINPLKNLNEEIDFCAMTPLQVENSLDKLYLIKNIIIGGAAVSDVLKNKIKNILKNNLHTKIYETYGMSETLSHIALKEIFPKEDNWFKILENIEIDLDERNCLKIYAPQLNSITLHTNDLVEIKNKNKFRFLGRLDNIINTGGAKIHPEQLESLLKKLITNEVVFIGKNDDSLGQKLILVIEGDKDKRVLDIVQQIEYEKKFHKPKEIVFIETIPRTPNGKIDRLKLSKIINDN